MNIWLEITKALIEVIKTGGVYAIGGIALWLILNIIKVCMILGFLYLALRLVLCSINNYICLKFISNQDNLTLLSKESSEKLCKSISEFQQSMTEAVTSFIKDAKDSLKPSGEQEQKK